MYTNMPCMLFSLEKTDTVIANYMIASLGGIPYEVLTTGKFDEMEMKKLITAVKKVSKLKLHIESKDRYSVGKICELAKQYKETNRELCCIVIDSLQLIDRVSNADFDSILFELKMLAKELDIAIIVTTQVKGNIEQRPNKRPLLADLNAVSDALIEYADNNIFIYRDEIYSPESIDKGIAEIIIAKQRNGQIGTIKLAFQEKYSRFLNLHEEPNS